MNTFEQFFPLKDIKDKGDWLRNREMYLLKLKQNHKSMVELQKQFQVKLYDRVGSTISLQVKRPRPKFSVLNENFLPSATSRYESPYVRWKIKTENYYEGKFFVVQAVLNNLAQSNQKHSEFIKQLLHQLQGVYFYDEFISTEKTRCSLNASNYQCIATIRQLDQIAFFYQ